MKLKVAILGSLAVAIAGFFMVGNADAAGVSAGMGNFLNAAGWVLFAGGMIACGYVFANQNKMK